MTASSEPDDLQSMGPVDFLVVEYPVGKIIGEPYPYLVSLVDTATIHILDIAFMVKELDGSVRQIELAELPEFAQLDLGIFEGASSGMLARSDVDEVGELLEPGSVAAIVVFENLWAAPFAAALRRSGAQLVAHGRIPVRALLAALDNAESASAISVGGTATPGLLRGVARASLAAAQAISVANRIARLHVGMWAERDVARAVRPGQRLAETSGEGLQHAAAELKNLAKLRVNGELTDAEFDARVDRVLMSGVASYLRTARNNADA